jgi:hypothetical protein
VLAVLAQNRSLDPAIRLAAAEEAAATGGLAIDQLQEAYAGVAFPPGALADPMAAAAKEPGPMGRALLYQAASATPDPQKRARLLQAALESARHQEGYLLAVPVNMTYLLPIAPSADLAWFAGDAGRALYVAGHYEQANAWLEQIQGGTGDAVQSAAYILGIYAQIAGVGPAVRALTLPHTNSGVRLMAVFEGLGQPRSVLAMIDPDQAPAEPPVPAADPALLFALSEAAAAHRIGETVLLSLDALGPEGPAGCNPLALARVIAGLRQIGFDSEARAIAIEAAIAAGV